MPICDSLHVQALLPTDVEALRKVRESVKAIFAPTIDFDALMRDPDVLAAISHPEVCFSSRYNGPICLDGCIDIAKYQGMYKGHVGMHCIYRCMVSCCKNSSVIILYVGK